MQGLSMGAVFMKLHIKVEHIIENITKGFWQNKI